MEKKEKDVLILGIESSCDETAAAVIRNGREVLSNIIASQIELHKLYGGVVPEIASRKHIEKINQVIEEALEEADCTLDDLDAIAVTYGPGLVGALLVGVAEAKAICFAKNIPLVGVHHIEGHVSANNIEHPDLEPPFLCLIVSGGHTHLVLVKAYGVYEIIGRTRDDAVGEAFDKVARSIGLGYPGGPKIDKLAKEGNPKAIRFPKAKIEDAPYDFSFSGVKSAVLNHINGCKMKGEEINEADIAASFQNAVVEVLVEKTMLAAKEYNMKTIYVFLAEGFEEVEALTPVDVLRRAGLPVKTVSVTGVLTVNGAHGVPVVADMVFEEVKEEDAEMIVLPGGLPGATNLDAHEGLGKLIMTFAEAGRPLSAICAAPLVYGKRGLLKGKKVTCYPGFEKYLEGAIIVV